MCTSRYMLYRGVSDRTCIYVDIILSAAEVWVIMHHERTTVKFECIHYPLKSLLLR